MIPYKVWAKQQSPSHFLVFPVPVWLGFWKGQVLSSHVPNSRQKIPCPRFDEGCVTTTVLTGCLPIVPCWGPQKAGLKQKKPCGCRQVHVVGSATRKVLVTCLMIDWPSFGCGFPVSIWFVPLSSSVFSGTKYNNGIKDVRQPVRKRLEVKIQRMFDKDPYILTFRVLNSNDFASFALKQLCLKLFEMLGKQHAICPTNNNSNWNQFSFVLTMHLNCLSLFPCMSQVKIQIRGRNHLVPWCKYYIWFMYNRQKYI